MDVIASWDWRAWSLLAVLAVVLGRYLWRWLSALVFRHLLLGGLLRRYGWQVDAPGGDHGRAEFHAKEKARRREAWQLLRQGRRGIRDGYRSGVFGRTQAGAWRPALTIRGAWHGQPFEATEIRRYELASEGSHQNVRRRAAVRVEGHYPVMNVRVGLLTGRRKRGSAPAPVLAAARARRWSFRGFTTDGAGMTVELGPRLRRGPLLKALEYARDVSARLE